MLITKKLEKALEDCGAKVGLLKIVWQIFG
jgi:hypothetical protein